MFSIKPFSLKKTGEATLIRAMSKAEYLAHKSAGYVPAWKDWTVPGHCIEWFIRFAIDNPTDPEYINENTGKPIYSLILSIRTDLFEQHDSFEFRSNGAITSNPDFRVLQVYQNTIAIPFGRLELFYNPHSVEWVL